MPRSRPETTQPADTGQAAPAATITEVPPAEAAVGDAELVGFRLPRARPDPGPRRIAKLLGSLLHFGFAPDLELRAALNAVDSGDYATARALAARHRNPVASPLVDWLVAREPDSGLSAAEIIAIIQSHEGWPEIEKIRVQAQRAFHATGPDDAAVLTFYSEAPPRTIGGRLALAAALQGTGQAAKAAEMIRSMWREDSLASGQLRTIIARFGSSLTPSDHLYRFRRLVLSRRTADAVAQAGFLGPGHANLARAVIAVLERNKEGERLLKSAGATFSGDPLYLYARLRLLRRAGKPLEAANLLLKAEAEAKVPGDAGAWWDERRDLSRAVLDLKRPDLAYKIVVAHKATADSDRAEAAFHAGWYALRFLKNAEAAEPHFQELLGLATLPRTRAKASYWLGRTLEAKGAEAGARLAYGEAAQFGGSFYGQLAREKIALPTTGLERTPAPSALDRIRFNDRDAVKAIGLLAAAGHADKAFPFFRGLAETIEAPGEITLLTALARRIDQPRAGMNAAAIAEQRGLRVASLAAPFLSIPAGLPLPDPVDRALVYAVARQESAFNHRATSHVGARGLMQLMPETARATARNAQMPFSVQRLTSDPLYNATLGAEHLGELLDRLDQSYILTFVGYNAGPGRARDWVKAYGDPRGGQVDPVDWVERIPFDETRNYVQKVMENLQIYRSRIGHPLSLSKDLIRGGPQG